MSEPFLGEIRMFAGTFAPRGWAHCDGQLLPVSQNAALFSILGTTYGGDGETTFALPDLRGRVPIHPGHGPGLTSVNLGQKGGVEPIDVTTGLAQAQTPHSHELSGGTTGGGITSTSVATVETTSSASSSVPGSTANRQPYLAINFIIALEGIYPSLP